ncbi:MAG: DUF58 domain-containing protein [Gemmataceae bacterium]
MSVNKARRFSFLRLPSSIRFPVAGRYFLMLAALPMLVIGVHRRINLLMLLGDVLVVMMSLNLLAAAWNVRSLRARRRCADWLFARTPCEVELQVRNPSRRARLGLRIEEEPIGADSRSESAGSRSATWLVDWLPARESISWRRQVVLPRRGRYAWGAVWASSGYPFGLVERRSLLTVEETVLVLPCLGWLHRGRFLRYLRDVSLQAQYVHLRRQTLPHAGAQAEFHGLRSYQSGDSPRLIHWRTSARRSELMVREFEDEPSDNLLIVLDPTLPAESDNGGVLPREQFEEMVSLIASICWEWCRRRGDRLVLATATAEPRVLDGLTGPAHARRLLECLAVVECGTSPVSTDVIASLQARRLPSALVVVMALGRSKLADPLRRVLARRVHCFDATCMERFDFYTPPS